MTAQQQWEEFECMLSMFPEREELQFDDALRDQYEQHVSFNGARPLTRLQYTIHYKTAQYFSQRIRPLPSELKDLGFGKEIPALEISYPPGYPEQDTIEFTVRCPFLSRHQAEALHTQLTLLATGAQGEVVVLQLYQQMLEVLTEVHVQYEENGADSMDLVQAVDSLRMTETGETQAVPEPVAGQMEVVLGRRAIYFHHIINPNKRRVVKEWALELQLGGFSKIGWPGIVLVEGREADAQEYVCRLQHLKWKQMVVRGEQIETSSTTSTTGEGETATIDAMRRLPRGFQEFPENGMSALASACRDAGVKELFLTTMKIYGRTSEIDGTTAAAAAQRSKGSKRNQKKPAKAAR